MEKKNLFGKCPYVTAQKVLTGKWSMYIMYLLSEGPIRFNELQRRMPEEMTHTTLSRQLKTLESEGLIIRKEYQQIPPKVEYCLSEIGEKFKTVLTVLEAWGNDYIQYLNNKSSPTNRHETRIAPRFSLSQSWCLNKQGQDFSSAVSGIQKETDHSAF